MMILSILLLLIRLGTYLFLIWAAITILKNLY